MSTRTNAVCGRVSNALLRLNKEILTPEDVGVALAAEGIDSRTGIPAYANPDGYLVKGGYLIRVMGGWTLSDAATENAVIIATVSPQIVSGQVYKQMMKAMRPFEGLVTLELQV